MHMETNKRKTRKQENVKPITGSVRWLRPLVLGKTLGRLAITNASGVVTEYDVHAFLDGDRLTGFGLAKNDDAIYCIDVSGSWGWTCDCADCQFRSRECKHIRGLRAALAHAGINVPVPPRPAPEPEMPPPLEDLSQHTVEFDDP
jgi:hypothetical protein